MTNRQVSGLQSVSARDEYIVVFKTKTPDRGFPGRLAAIQMVPIEYFRQIGEDAFAQQPIGTGPYKVDEWGSNRIALSANPKSWRAPKIDELIILEMPEATSRIQGLLSGSIDVAINLSTDEEANVKAQGGRLHTRQLGGTSVISFITERDSPLQDPQVRIALNLAVDKQSLVDVLMAGKTVAVGQPAVRTAFGFDPSLKAYEYAPNKAKMMLIEAGYPDGFDMMTDVVPGGSANIDAIYQKISSDLARIGVRMKLHQIPLPKLVEGINQGSFKGIAFWMNYSTLPTLNTLEPMELHSCLWPRPWHCDESVTTLVRNANQEFDPQKQKALIGQVLRALHKDPPAIWLFESVAFDGIGPRVSAYEAYLGTIRYDRINLVKQELASRPLKTTSD
jgi:peptide/nickel transport system substrate-binding protein